VALGGDYSILEDRQRCEEKTYEGFGGNFVEGRKVFLRRRSRRRSGSYSGSEGGYAAKVEKRKKNFEKKRSCL